MNTIFSTLLIACFIIPCGCDSCDFSKSAPFVRWEKYLIQGPVKYELKKERKLFSFELFTNVEVNDFSGMQGDSKGRYYLELTSCFYFEKKEGKFLLTLGDPDNYVEIYVPKTKSLYRIFETGSVGVFHNAYWLDENCFIILGEVERVPFFCIGDVKCDKLFYYELIKGKRKNVSAKKYIYNAFIHNCQRSFKYVPSMVMEKCTTPRGYARPRKMRNRTV